MIQSVEGGNIEVQASSEATKLSAQEEDSVVQKVRNVALRFFTSPLVLFFSAIIGTVVAFAAVNLTVLGCFLVGASMVGVAYNSKKLPKSLLYELAIMYNLARDFLSNQINGKPNYHHEILPGIHLGALPLKTFGHTKLISEELGAKAVLSVVEGFEMDTDTIISTPVRKEDWKEVDVNHMIISVEDHCALSQNDLCMAADFINENKDGVYVHCKSGMGRGPSAVVAYLIKYKSLTFNEAHNFVKDIRGIHINEEQKLALKTFEMATLK